ncbi:MAG: ABC transporter ATP-binding protein, partial [Cyanobacteria bacterium SZAS LIN-3]|nr:ABC transporter ATP-binding protein [Cyanobacteria bacterium SZAS LIN-3]
AAYTLLKSVIAPWRVSMFADSLHIVLDEPGRDWPVIERAVAGFAGLIELSRRSLGFSLEDAFISIVQRSTAAQGGA